MSKIITATQLVERHATRYPNQAEAGEGITLLASEEGARIEAAAVRGFSAGPATLVYVKAKEHFYVAGEFIGIGDFVQVTDQEAKQLVALGRADLATDDAVAAAQKATKK